MRKYLVVFMSFSLFILSGTSLAETTFFVGAGLKNDQMQPQFNQLVLQEPTANGSWQGSQIGQRDKSSVSAAKLSLMMRDTFVQNRVFVSASLDFQGSLATVGTGQIDLTDNNHLSWKLNPIAQIGLTSRVGYTPTAWKSGNSELGIYLSIGAHKANSDFTVAVGGQSETFGARGKTRTVGLGLAYERGKHLLDFGLNRTDGFMDYQVDTSKVPSTQLLAYEFDVKYWALELNYFFRLGQR